ncbi:MAG: Hsp70 family protein, partial [Endozoicomonadaceae bacterium]|nr:Hsp70 family protein [Endozoicomonadaceae bacterium]
SAVAGYNDSEVKVYKTSEGSDTLASVIYVDKRGHKLYGKRAYDQTLLSPENVAAGFKRLMGTSTKIDLKASSLAFSSEECSADILKQLIGQVFTESGSEEINGTVITIPAAFNQMQSEATIRAAEMAGLEKVALLQEPIAAAMAAMSCSKNKNGQFLVYDLGGGTFFKKKIQSISGAINIIAHEGINMLGGRDFDRAIVNSYVRPWIMENFNLPDDFQKQEKYRRVIRIAHLAAEKAKINLSTMEKEIIFASDDEVRVQDENGNDIYLEVELTRTDLEQLISEEVQKTIELSRKILKDNGYSYEDIDRIVFIGGPTKMPYIRSTVSQDLGIPADLQVDPMTAVAQGAAIYCESREWDVWDGETTKRKTSRASQEVTGKINIKYDYPSRSSDDKAKLRLKSSNIADGCEVEINSAFGWTSGRIPVTNKTSVDLYLSEMGKNSFHATVFDKTGKPVKEAAAQFVITRTHASSIGVPATQTIAVKVREGTNSNRNKLIAILEKGTSLPAKGSQKFRAALDLPYGKKEEHLDFELYQDEGVSEPELNLCIGVFRVSGNDLEYGMKIREGDEIIFHWKMSDSGLLTATVELASTGQSFDTPKFYVDQAGHQSFDLNSGTKLAKSVLKDAEKDLDNVKNAIGCSANEEYEKIEKELESQHDVLDNASEGETTRAVTEKARHIRQQISKLKHSPENRGKVLKQEILQEANMFDDYNRENVGSEVINRFDSHKNNALACIDKGDQKAFQEAEAHLKEMGTINGTEIWKNPGFLLEIFEYHKDQAYLATDPEKYQLLLQRGAKAIDADNIDELRSVLFELGELKASVAGAKQPMAKLASIMAA